MFVATSGKEAVIAASRNEESGTARQKDVLVPAKKEVRKCVFRLGEKKC